jgi:hypothetical protein
MIATSSREPRILVAGEYAAALGRAVYTFSYLEWSVVWLTETLSPDFLSRVGGMTAGTIAREFETLASASTDADAGELQSLADTFSALVLERNGLVHGVPYTSAAGDQRLQHVGKSGRRDWSLEAIHSVTDKFEAAAIIATRLLHSGRYEAYTATGRSLSI